MRRAAAVCSLVLVVLATGVPAQATFAGKNGLIFYDTQFGGQASQIFSVRPSGGGVLQLTSFGDGSSALSPRVSADGGRVVFTVRDPSGQTEVWVMTANGSNRHPVSHDAGYDDAHPNWSPDGSRIVFSRCSQYLFTCRIATMNLNGNDVREVTHGYWHDGLGDLGAPVYSPDGTRIVFTSDRGGYDSRLWVVRAEGTNLRPITPARITAGLPDWSPDGARIVFTGGTHVPFIGVVRPDGSGLHRIGPVVCCAAYSPDGRKFTVHDDASFGLSVMNSDGSGLHLVPGVPAGVGDSAWGVAR